MTTTQEIFIRAHQRSIIGDYIIIFSRSTHIGFSYRYCSEYEAFLVPVFDPMTIRYMNNYYVSGDTSNRIKICDRLTKKDGQPYRNTPMSKIRALAIEIMSTPEFTKTALANKLRRQ